jgi:hypothetical protein
MLKDFLNTVCRNFIWKLEVTLVLVVYIQLGVSALRVLILYMHTLVLN